MGGGGAKSDSVFVPSSVSRYLELQVQLLLLLSDRILRLRFGNDPS